MKQLLILLTAVAIPILAFNTGWSQEYESEHEFAYGNLVSKDKNQITVTEYDYDADEERIAVYVVNHTTKFQGFPGIMGLQADDAIEITYVLKGNKKVAVMISKDTEDLDSIEEFD